MASPQDMIISQDKFPDTCPVKFTRQEYMDVIDILTPLDSPTMTPKVAKLRLLTLAAEMDLIKGRVIEGIADMLTKLPVDVIAEKNKVGEVDIQTRYYEPLLSSMLSVNTEKVMLRWPSKTDEVTASTRPDAIISTLVQSRFGCHLAMAKSDLAMTVPPHNRYVETQ